MSPEETKKNELIKIIKDTKREAEEGVVLGGEISRHHQSVVDLADASLRVLGYKSPPGFDVEYSQRAWRQEYDRQNETLRQIPPIVTRLQMGTPGAAAAFAMADLASPQVFSDFQPIGMQESARFVSQQLSNVITKLADKDHVLALLQRFQLDKAASNKKSAFKLFEIAWEAYEKPVSPNSSEITSLIPMRQCIEVTIEALLAKRPQQARTGSWHNKICSIGEHLFYNDIPSGEIELLADQWHSISTPGSGLVDRLSGVKTYQVPREECLNMLKQVTLFLRKLLTSIDRTKLRS